MIQPNRIEIKELAREKIKDNIFNIWKPLIIIILLELGASTLIENLFNESFIKDILNSFVSVLGYVLLMGFVYYLIKLVRNKKYHIEDIFYYFEHHLYECIITGLLVTIFIILWSFLFIIPGIIAALGYAMWSPIFVDSHNKDPLKVIKQSKKLMYGHKWDFLVFNLSFIGWFFLCIITFGLALIYVLPYLYTSQLLYYEKLKEVE